MQIEKQSQSVFPSMTYQVETPDGTMYVNLIENNKGSVIAIQVQIGKTGSSLRTWTECLARLMTIILEKGGTLEDIIEEISQHTTAQIRRTVDGANIRSGPDGICHVLMQYRRDRHIALRKEMGLTDDVIERRGRGSSFSSR